MRYEVYGVISEEGFNVLIETRPSMRQAFQVVNKLNAFVYRAFIILEKTRRHSAPISMECGKTAEGKSVLSKSFVTGENPIHEKDGRTFWSKHWKTLIDGSFT